MKKIDKKLLSTFLSLDNKKADEFLVNLAEELKIEVLNAKDNESIVEAFETLKEFVYKVPLQTIDMVRHVMTHALSPQEIDGPMGSFTGKDHADVMEKAIELLREIRYIHSEGVLSIISELVRSDRSEKIKALDVLKRLAKYDLHVLTKSKLGYNPQRWVLDFILKWSLDEQKENLDFIEVATRELLDSSVEGTMATAVDTITFQTGAVKPSPFLKTLRRDTIDLIARLCESVEDERRKLKLTKVLEEAVSGPTNVVYGDDLVEMLRDDGQYVIQIYKKILFNEDEKLVGSIAVAEEVEKRLYWFQRSERFNTPEARKLRENILADEFFSLFRLFAGDDIVYREESKIADPESTRTALVEVKVDEVTEANLEAWDINLNRIAAQLGIIEEWQFQHLKIFLRQLAVKKPEVAFTLLDDALRSDRPLKQFIGPVLEGFREGKRFDLWDALVGCVVEKRDPKLISPIPYSLILGKDADLAKEIRDKDIQILEEIVERAGIFSFLGKLDQHLLALEHATINSLLRNFRRDMKRVEKLLLKAAARYPQWRGFQVRELSYAQFKGWISYAQFSDKAKNVFTQWLVELEDLDWDAQAFLVGISEDNPGLVFDVFGGRIEKDARRKENKRRLIDEVRYQAIPYHFNPELAKYLSNITDFSKRFQPWLDKIKPEWSVYNWNVAHFLKASGTQFDPVVQSLLARRDDVSVGKAVQLMDRFDGENIDLYMDVVRRTDNKKILSVVEGMLSATGVVSGEDGIARAYEAKALELEKYQSDESPRVKKYAKRMKARLLTMAKRQRQAALEDRQIRKIEFEG